MKLSNWLKLSALAGTAFALMLTWGWRAASAAGEHDLPSGYEMPFGANPFAPSNSKTTTGRLIEQSEFIPAARCASCHKETHAEWSESAHRNSFREPFYQANVNHLIGDRSITVTRHCESCHNPVALFSGALSKNATMERPFDDEGVSCSVCHSIESTTTEGIGSYVIAPPALLVRADGVRVSKATDGQIKADIDSHRRAVMRPLLKTPEFCAACHKAAVVPELNKRKWLRSFSAYDEWQQSALSTETVQPLNSRARQSCQACHMPKSETGYTLHRWPGGNTAIPAWYKWPKQSAATAELLQSNVLSVDVFAWRAHSAPADVNAPAGAGGAALPRGVKVTVDVVVSNKNVGHSFPAELRDIFEAWLEFEATDAAGRVLAHSGAVSEDGTLEASAHAYRAVPIDDAGRPITKHDIWNTRVTALDRNIAAGRADLGCFSFVLPSDARGPVKLTARVNYRRFNKRFTDWVSRSTPVGPSPVVRMAEASVSLPVGDATPAPAGGMSPSDASALRKRWRSYGVALFDQQQYEEAARAFERALKLAEGGSADEVASNVDLAMTLLRVERAGSSRLTAERAARALARALEIDPANARARYFRALLGVKTFQYTEALADLETLSRAYPRDRQVWTQLASLYLLQRRDDEALASYRQVLGIDPDDNEAHFKLAGLFWRFQMPELAKREQDAYQPRHPDSSAETMRRSFLRANPEFYVTWPWREFGDNPIGSMP